MAQNLNKTKRRIASVNSTKKMTNAMELVATVKLGRYKSLLEKNRAYVEEIVNLIHTLFARQIEGEENVFQTENSATNNLYLVITSNLGLCASFNNDVYKYVENNVSKENNDILIIGKKGNDHFSRLGYSLIDEYTSLNEKLVYEDVVKLSRNLTSLFTEGKYHSINIIYTKYVNSIKFVPEEIKIFPLGNLSSETNKELGYSPIFDPNVKTLIEELVPIYITSLIYNKIVESTVSEQASRRTAMDNATDNANELIEQLTLEYNKARQTAITQEITEVVSSSIDK